jgi:hypothetical protein
MKLMTTCAHFTSPRGETTFLLIVSGASEKEKGSVPGHRRLRKRTNSDAKTIKTNTTPSVCVFDCTFIRAPLESAYLFNYRSAE